MGEIADMIIDHNNPVKVLIWNDPKDKQERYPIFFCKENKCVAVKEYFEDYYLNGYSFETITWKHWAPIPEKKKRMMTGKELFEKGAVWWRGPEGKPELLISLFHDFWEREVNTCWIDCEWTADRKHWHSFEKDNK